MITKENNSQIRKTKTSRIKSLIAGGLAAIASTVSNAQDVASMNVAQVREPLETPLQDFDYNYHILNISGQVAEWHLIHKGKQFGTIIQDRGNVVFRGHAGVDPDGYGTSNYMRPFFPNAQMYGLEGFQIIIGENGLYFTLTGKIPYAVTNTMGQFSLTELISYNPTTKKVLENGTLTLSLDRSIQSIGQDLNIRKIASSYLYNVPLQDGSTGDTGDMKLPHITGNNLDFVWDVVAQPAHFPWDFTDNLTIDIPGEVNTIDTARQGYAPIKRAAKPGLKAIMTSTNPQLKMIFGGIYSRPNAQNFWSDNVGITPLIIQAETNRNFSFAINNEWTAPVEDTAMDELTLTSQNATNIYFGVYGMDFSTNAHKRIGSIGKSGTSCTGVLKIPTNSLGIFYIKED